MSHSRATSFIWSFILLHFATLVANLCATRMAYFAKAQHKAQAMNIPLLSSRYSTYWVPFRSTLSCLHFSRIQSSDCKYFFPAHIAYHPYITEDIKMYLRQVQYLQEYNWL